MKRRYVESISLRLIGYDTSTRTLDIEFRSGSRYQYLNVPKGVYLALMMAPSRGHFFSVWIRDRYEFRRLR
jgi:hypothetical protein